jgi:hypothetical protein
MNKIYILSKYEYNTYSYDGLIVGEETFYKSLEGAEAAARNNGFVLVANATSDKHATISEARLYD